MSKREYELHLVRIQIVWLIVSENTLHVVIYVHAMVNAMMVAHVTLIQLIVKDRGNFLVKIELKLHSLVFQLNKTSFTTATTLSLSISLVIFALIQNLFSIQDNLTI